MENSSFINSPVIQKNTPIKRLGLSRKRKSSGSVETSIASSEKSPKLDIATKGAHEPEKNSDTVDHLLNYEKELEAIKIKISEKEEKLKTLQKKNKNILELEDLINCWKTGFENSFLELMQILRNKDPNIKTKFVLNKLGIWETVFRHFEHDNGIFLSLD